MSKKPLVTIICLCYNQERFLIEALNSVKNQTYKNIEVIIIDDASIDNSVESIKTWIESNEATFIQNKNNLGNTKTFNKALKFAKGDYIVDFATDDILLPSFVEAQVNQFEKSKYKNVGVVFSNIEHIDENGNHISFLYEINDDFTAKKRPLTGNIYKNLVHSYFLNATSMLIKTEVLKQLNGYDETLAYEDVDFWFRSSRLFEYDYTDKVLVKKRSTQNSLSTYFKQKKGINLGFTTYKNCKTALSLNQNNVENKALKNRVIYQLRLAYKNRDIYVFTLFLYLLIKLNIIIIYLACFQLPKKRFTK